MVLPPATPPELSALNERRVHAENAIVGHYLSLPPTPTDAQRADWHQRAYELHENLVTVLEATERAARTCAPSVAGALRWSITGARLRGEAARDAGIEWRKLAEGDAAR